MKLKDIPGYEELLEKAEITAMACGEIDDMDFIDTLIGAFEQHGGFVHITDYEANRLQRMAAHPV
ncbi:MAG: hypothetical protein WC571_02190 [Candidatus Omnitrophota bacterium]